MNDGNGSPEGPYASTELEHCVTDERSCPWHFGCYIDQCVRSTVGDSGNAVEDPLGMFPDGSGFRGVIPEGVFGQRADAHTRGGF